MSKPSIVDSELVNSEDEIDVTANVQGLGYATIIEKFPLVW
jgi:hypothetical protein